MKDSALYTFGALSLGLLSIIYFQHKQISIERDINAALRSRVESLTSCDNAVRESRMLFDKMVKLRRASDNTAQNTKGYDNHEEYDRHFTAGLY